MIFRGETTCVSANHVSGLVQSGECEEEATGRCPAQLAQCVEAGLLVEYCKI